MDRSRVRARALVASALAAVEAELASPSHALHPEQLHTCRATLVRYLGDIDADALPPRRERGEPLGRLVADAWGFDVPLAPVVLQAERAWRTC
jgi:hypothetical protein